MKQFSNYKRAYYGYFITFIRVDIYNKIILKAVLEDKSKLNYNNINLENSLKNELQKKHKMHYFEKYFNYRLEFYNKYYPEYEYDVYITIDLIYEYRNFLLDDQTRIELSKFPLIENKSLEEKEIDIKKIITLLLSENILEKYSTYIQDNDEQQTLLNYQSHFFCQNERVVQYRKYLNRYFGYTNYNSKITFLRRYRVGGDVSLAKKYQLLIQLFISLNTLSEEEMDFFTDLDVKITKDYLDANFGLVEVKGFPDSEPLLMSFNQFFILYFLKKQDSDFSFNKFLKYLDSQKLKKSYNNKNILLSKNIYEYHHSYFKKVQENKKVMKYIKGRQKNGEIDSMYLLKLIVVKRALNRNIKNISKYINTKNFEKNLLAVELITGYFDKRNIMKSVKKYLMMQYQDIENRQEEIFSIFNQMKFTMNINNLNKMRGLGEKQFNKLRKDYKEKKRFLVEKYIETVYILIKLRVHKYNKDKTVQNAYIYRNNVMHFEKEVSYDKRSKRIILYELRMIKIKENILINKITFDDVFFHLLKLKK